MDSFIFVKSCQNIPLGYSTEILPRHELGQVDIKVLSTGLQGKALLPA